MNTELGNQIKQLRGEGFSYREISKRLDCAKSTVAYYCSDNEKENVKNRQEKQKKKNIGYFSARKRLDNFKRSNHTPRKSKKVAETAKEKLKKKQNMITHYFRNRELNEERFNFNEVVKKFGDNPKCYLTGKDIDWNDPNTFSFDHIVPVSKGGKNTLDNLGLCRFDVNQSKNDLSVEEFVSLCKEVLENFGYKVKK
jgi:CRISPR/Cas system Type II protein with McrA/HNH and RuvC-like nuclease domain